MGDPRTWVVCLDGVRTHLCGWCAPALVARAWVGCACLGGVLVWVWSNLLWLRAGLGKAPLCLARLLEWVLHLLGLRVCLEDTPRWVVCELLGGACLGY